jgi:hypothetical protein
VISVAAFDKRIECLDDSKRTADVEEFVQSVDDLFTLSGELGFDIPLWQYFPTKNWRKFVKAADLVFA